MGERERVLSVQQQQETSPENGGQGGGQDQEIVIVLLLLGQKFSEQLRESLKHLKHTT